MVIEFTLYKSDSEDKKVFCSDESLTIKYQAKSPIGKARINKHFNYFTQEPILYDSHSDENLSKNGFTADDLVSLQNEVSGVSVYEENNKKVVLLYSAKLSRSRLFYIIKGNSLYVSPDLRLLLPYSDRVLNKEIAYSIIKFGETPEYYTIINDIFCVPGGGYFKAEFELINRLIKNGKLAQNEFSNYFQVTYSQVGGSLIDTEAELKKALKSMGSTDPFIFASGGIDSTLLNFLYNDITDQPYPAIFLNFDKSPEEFAYAQASAKNTKAELITVDIDESDIYDDFCGSVEKLIYPVYDNGSALVGYKLSNYLSSQNHGSNLSFIDGTVADSCYGVRDYNYKLKEGKNQSKSMSYFKEWIYSQLLLKGINISKTKPRDAFLSDEFLQDLLWNGGPFVNTWFKNAEAYTLSLKKEIYNYQDLLNKANREEYWPVYTILKMAFYAAKQTTVKMYDMLLPHQVYFPFMFKSILVDQGKYTWEQKSENHVVKSPLKSLLEKRIDHNFIYRKKSGLQSQTKQWIMNPRIKPFIRELLAKKNGVASSMMGSKQNSLISALGMTEPPMEIRSLALSLAVIQLWCDVNNIICE